MTLATMEGQPNVRRMLLQSAGSGRVAHAYVFTGPGETVKIAFAKAWAQAILCHEEAGTGCGRCPVCRTIGQDNYPNWHVLEPDGATIKIDQIREIRKMFQMRAHDGGKKIFIIKQAEKMTEPSANSLLKWLEEPDSDLLVILLASNRRNLLQTIVSRVQEIAFQPESPERLKQLIRTQRPELPGDVSAALAAVCANLEEALELADSEWFAELHGKMIKWAQSIFLSPAKAMLTYQELIGKGMERPQFAVWIRLLQVWYRDLAYMSSGQHERLVHQSVRSWMMANAGRKPASYWLSRMERIQQMVHRVRLNANIQGLMDELVLEEGGIR